LLEEDLRVLTIVASLIGHFERQLLMRALKGLFRVLCG